jgi:PAS domain S-box-containing protein
MVATSPAMQGRIDGIPTRELLEGLGQLHHLVVVTDTQGTVQWASRALARALGGADRVVGGTLMDLCLEYLARRRDSGPSSQERLAPHERHAPHEHHAPHEQHAIRNASIARRLDSILSELAHRPSILDHRLDLGASAGVSAAFDVNAFRVDSHGSGAAPPTRLYVGIMRPVRRQAREAPFAAGDPGLLGALLKETPDGLLAIDQSGFISYANPAASRLLGRSAVELTDKPVALFLPTAPYLVSNPKTHPGESSQAIEVQKPSGGSTWLSISTRPLQIPDRHDAGQILHLRDVTHETKQLAKLKKENAALESYVHSISHDLRSPLVSLLGFTRLLRQDYEGVLDEQGQHFLTRVEQAGQTMEMLIRDLLELSRIEGPCYQRAPVDPRNVLLQIHAELKPRLDERGVTLSLPQSPPMVRCERTQLYQIFSNLIGNALQHMGPHPRPVIQVEISEGPGHQTIAIRDNGKGIAAAAHDRIFEAFHTLETPESAQSSGIGLAIVKKIALAHGGRVWVESEPGLGATFFVSLKRRH